MPWTAPAASPRKVQPGEIIFGFLTVWMAVISRLQSFPTKVCANILVAMWVICMAITHFLSYQFAEISGPLLDLIAGSLLAFLWSKYPKIWILALSISFAVQLAAHSAYSDGVKTTHREWVLWFEINTIYVLQLLLVICGPRAKIGSDILQSLFRAPDIRSRRRYDILTKAERSKK